MLASDYRAALGTSCGGRRAGDGIYKTKYTVRMSPHDSTEQRKGILVEANVQREVTLTSLLTCRRLDGSSPVHEIRTAETQKLHRW